MEKGNNNYIMRMSFSFPSSAPWIMFYVITNIYNKKTIKPTLLECS
jgi:hypothetical protein